MSIPPNPHRIYYEQGMDPDAPWTITRPQPVASLVAEGVALGFTSSRPAPAVMCGRVLTLHAGAASSDVALVRIGEAARAALADRAVFQEVAGDLPEETAANPRKLARLERDPWRDTLERLPRSSLIGTARLVACYRIAHVMPQADGSKVYADVSDWARRRAIGVWPDYDGRVTVTAGDWSRGRWAWWFDSPVAFRGPGIRPVLGFGNLWHRDRGLALRASEAQRAADKEYYDAAVDAQEGGV